MNPTIAGMIYAALAGFTLCTLNVIL
ncbi:MAG: hypothetical protein JWR10_1101, partial [Rubritepida sp.]|nr:hypothetical protein [Rubritepida sp.]